MRAPTGSFCHTGTRRSAFEQARPSSAKYTMSHSGSGQNQYADTVTWRRATSVSIALTVRSSTLNPLVPLRGQRTTWSAEQQDEAQQSDISPPARTEYPPWSAVQSQALFE